MKKKLSEETLLQQAAQKYQSLSEAQKEVVSTKSVRGNATAKEWITFLKEIMEYDDIARSYYLNTAPVYTGKRPMKQTLKMFYLVGGFFYIYTIILLFTNEGLDLDIEHPKFWIVLGIVTGIAIMVLHIIPYCIYEILRLRQVLGWKNQVRNNYLATYVNKLIFPLLLILEQETKADEHIILNINWKMLEDGWARTKNTELKSREKRWGKWTLKMYEYPLFSLETKLLDGSLLQLHGKTVIRERRKSKKGFTGYKYKAKNIYNILISPRLNEYQMQQIPKAFAVKKQDEKKVVLRHKIAEDVYTTDRRQFQSGNFKKVYLNMQHNIHFGKVFKIQDLFQILTGAYKSFNKINQNI